ncbi:MAG: DUF340 domain-containing protein [Firmicutes bacterium]|nr:DUF340 domain-containing protein [Bacillota bacterium]
MTTASVFRVFIITAVLSLVGNWLGFNINPIAALPGMIILLILVALGYWLSRVSPIKLPSIAYISALAIIASIPGVPGANLVAEYVGRVEFLSLTTPVLAYTGISIGKDLDAFRRQGPKIVVIALLTFLGTFVGSALIAQVVLKLTGAI